ncbi:MAG TPA: HEAT repeat domain-containing protein [Pirellulales bacterium]|nr:HEAT repeat domain-containing protein [Pirellulales bacterium]
MTDRPRLTAARMTGLWVCALALLLSAGCESSRELSDRFSSDNPGKNARILIGDPRADARRRGMLYLVDRNYGRKPPYTTLYQQIALSDPDALVRATAIRSLNRSRDASATKVFVTALNDPSPLVRLEAVKALHRVPDPNAIEPLLDIVNNSDDLQDIRIAAAEALEDYRNFNVGRTLASLLNSKEFGVAWQARRSLKYMTGKDFDYDETAWLDYLGGPTKPLG